MTLPQSGIILNQVNCQNAFGAHLSGLITKLYPHAKEAYHTYASTFTPEKLLGKLQIIPLSKDLYLANSYSQNHYSRNPKDKHTIENALIYNIQRLHRLTQVPSSPYYNLPLYAPEGLGINPGGGDPNILRPVFEEYQLTLFPLPSASAQDVGSEYIRNDTLYFYGYNHPFSHYYQAPFLFRDKLVGSGLQAYAIAQIAFLKQRTTGKTLLTLNDYYQFLTQNKPVHPRLIQPLLKAIQPLIHTHQIAWSEIAKATHQEIAKDKVTQVPATQDYLLDHAELTFKEASFDKESGIGHTLNYLKDHPNAKDKGFNYLGQAYQTFTC